MAFYAYIQNTFSNNENKIYDSLELINDMADQLDIQESDVNKIIKDVVDKNYQNDDKYIQDSDIQNVFNDISQRIHPPEKKGRKVVNLVDMKAIKQLHLEGEYRTFHDYYKNGCTNQQLQQLRDQMLTKVQNYLK